MKASKPWPRSAPNSVCTAVLNTVKIYMLCKIVMITKVVALRIAEEMSSETNRMVAA